MAFVAVSATSAMRRGCRRSAPGGLFDAGNGGGDGAVATAHGMVKRTSGVQDGDGGIGQKPRSKRMTISPLALLSGPGHKFFDKTLCPPGGVGRAFPHAGVQDFPAAGRAHDDGVVTSTLV